MLVFPSYIFFSFRIAGRGERVGQNADRKFVQGNSTEPLNIKVNMYNVHLKKRGIFVDVILSMNENAGTNYCTFVNSVI